MNEFELIQTYFTNRQKPADWVQLGIGDDCALMTPNQGMQLAISTDMLVAGRHFFDDANPLWLGHKALAVNLSDLAAMGAAPRGFTLALALPKVNATWLQAFSDGLFALANLHNCPLIGGDTTKGPLTISITVFGEVSLNQALRRDAAQIGDDIWISGSLGDAKLALEGLLNNLTLAPDVLTKSAQRLHQPTPRLALGQALRGVAHAAIDLSDGLMGDLGHILKRANVGATIDCDALPCGEQLRLQSQIIQREFALTGGDDYELCFTAPQSRRDAVLKAGELCKTPVTKIGTIEAQTGLRIMDKNRDLVNCDFLSFDHFRD